MATTCGGHRRSRPTTYQADPLAALMIATDAGRIEAVAVAMLDARALFIVDDAPAGETGYILNFFLDAVRPPPPEVMIATSRPGTAPDVTAEERQMWPVLVAAADQKGVTLKAWFAMTDGRVRVIGSLD
jgi:hypothetical protein